MDNMKDVNFKYQARLCNEAVYDIMVKFKMAELDDEQIKLMLECVGKALVRCAFDDQSIHHYIKHYQYMLLHDAQS